MILIQFINIKLGGISIFYLIFCILMHISLYNISENIHSFPNMLKARYSLYFAAFYALTDIYVISLFAKNRDMFFHFFKHNFIVNYLPIFLMTFILLTFNESIIIKEIQKPKKLVLVNKPLIIFMNGFLFLLHLYLFQISKNIIGCTVSYLIITIYINCNFKLMHDIQVNFNNKKSTVKCID